VYIARKQQEKYYFELLSSNSIITQQEQQFLQAKEEMEAGGYRLITNKDGTITPYTKPKDHEPFPGRVIKKKNKIKTDFYRF
jgi:hypothetical protein